MPSVVVAPATPKEKLIVRHLLELYKYDFSEFDGADVDAFGLYGYRYLDHYWTEADRHPFLIRNGGKLAGFALVRAHAPRTGEPAEMAEFFVLRKYRRCGVGRAAAHWLFNHFPGPWEVREAATNHGAHAFWRRVIGEYTNGRFTELDRNDADWHGPVQTFIAPHMPDRT